jgi:hypothetical protein
MMPQIRPISDLRNKFAHDIDLRLIEACEEAMRTDKRFTHDEVMEHMREIITMPPQP